MREPYRPGDDLVGHLYSAIREESAAFAPQTSTLIELAKAAALEIRRLRAALDKAERENEMLRDLNGSLTNAAERAFAAKDAEIKRLREEIEALRLIYPEGTADRITFLEIDNKRLRAALQ
jgi:hypothetical protein